MIQQIGHFWWDDVNFRMLFMTCSLFESRHWSNQTSKGGKLLVRIADTWSFRNAVFGDIFAFFHKIGLRLKLVTENQEGGTNNSKVPAENLQVFRWSQWLFTMSDILELISQRFYLKSFLYPFICSIFLTFWFLYTYTIHALYTSYESYDIDICLILYFKIPTCFLLETIKSPKFLFPEVGSSPKTDGLQFFVSFCQGGIFRFPAISFQAIDDTRDGSAHYEVGGIFFEIFWDDAVVHRCFFKDWGIDTQQIFFLMYITCIRVFQSFLNWMFHKIFMILGHFKDKGWCGLVTLEVYRQISADVFLIQSSNLWS